MRIQHLSGPVGARLKEFYCRIIMLATMFCCIHESDFVLEHGCTNPGQQITMANKCCMVMPNISGSSV
jgi:hypothetical protein